jgi:hypothetical protein
VPFDPCYGLDHDTFQIFRIGGGFQFKSHTNPLTAKNAKVRDGKKPVYLAILCVLCCKEN